uniref:Uncharacterized protein n=1 Tax=Plectus sambesii TaxID=2011161 RepID=A0A914XPX0_9BILA
MRYYEKSPHNMSSHMSFTNAVGYLKVPKTIYIVSFILVVGIIMTVVNVYQLRLMQQEHYQKTHGYASSEAVNDLGAKKRPIVWVKGRNVHSGYLDHVFAVFRRLGYAVGDENSDWDVLWHHDYPFLQDSLRSMLQNLPAHKKVNHIPGSGFYTSKVNLATSNVTAGIPPAFELPLRKEEFLAFANSHPEKYWVQKSNRHRGIQIKQIQDLNLEQDNSFVQEYIANPFLIDKRKFDIGIYTVVTSVNPLRVYIYEGDALLRFCPQDYHPFDPNNVDKYVVGDDYTPTWQMPSLSKYFTDLDMNFRESLNSYVRSVGKDPERIWSQIRETIRQVFQAKQKEIQLLIDNYKSQTNFFELSRFDFVLDEELNVYLMEANMSPNLGSGHFPPNKLLYEQVIMNMLSLVGVGTQLHGESLAVRELDVEHMMVSPKDMRVFGDKCISPLCAESCNDLVCRLCRKCLDARLAISIRQAYQEHLNRRNMRRIIPAPVFEKARPANHPTTEDRLMELWFKGKCDQDSSWCR